MTDLDACAIFPRHAYRGSDLTSLFYARILIRRVHNSVYSLMGGVNYYRDRSLFIRKTLATIQRQSELNDEIRSLYLSGVPLFTKEQIYAVRQQLKELEGKCGKLLVTGLNGNVTEFVVKTGHVLPSDTGVERVM